ncbi:hypothetical protein K2W90_02970 [Candidatus Babeliales bacterium]|nr:hypothetical protein [Candidatus Babeliales bacterium]
MKFLRTALLSTILVTSLVSNNVYAAATSPIEDLRIAQTNRIMSVEEKIQLIRNILYNSNIQDIDNIERLGQRIDTLEASQNYEELKHVGLSTIIKKLIDLLQAPHITQSAATQTQEEFENNIRRIFDTWHAQLPYREMTTREVLVLQVLIPFLVNLLEPAATEFKQLEPDDQDFSEGAYVAVRSPLFQGIKMLFVIGNFCMILYEIYKVVPRITARTQRAARAVQDNCAIL